MKQNFSEPTFNTLVDLLRYRAKHQPDQLAYAFWGDGETEQARMTYVELDRHARSIGALLQSRLNSNERVLLLYPSGLEYIAAFFGCLYAGMVAVPAYPVDSIRPTRTLPRLQAIVKSAQVKMALTTSELLPLVEPLFVQHNDLRSTQVVSADCACPVKEDEWQMPAATANTLAFLMYTSGSTGTPRGAMLNHRNALYNLAQFPAFEARPCTGVVSWLPFFHDLGLFLGILHPLYQGVPATLMSPISFAQRPFCWLQAISRCQASATGGPNFAYELCVQRINPQERAALDLSSWTVALNGAEPVRSETLERFAQTFEPCGFQRQALYPSYGLAEAAATVSGGRAAALPVVYDFERTALEQGRVVKAFAQSASVRTLVGCGGTVPGQKIAIVNPNSLIVCSPDQVGEIWVSGPSISEGYWDQPEETRQFLQARLADTAEGPFLRTGDMGFLLDGELFIAGRLKDLIIIRGANHHPEDIELTVEQSNPAVRPGCVAAFSVEVGAEERLVAVAEVKTLSPSDTNQVIGDIRQKIAQDHDLSTFAIVLIKPGTILKTSSGKIRRQACRDEFLAAKLDVVAQWQAVANQEIPLIDQSPEPFAARAKDKQIAESIEGWLIRYCAKRVGVSPEEIDASQAFTRYGIGSLESLALMHDLEDWLGRSLSPVLAWSYPSLEKLAAYLARDSKISDALMGGDAASAKVQEPIAIIGMAGRFPGADNPQAFWDLVANGVDAVRQVPPDRWDVDVFYDPNPNAKGKIVSQWGGYLENPNLFDASFFGISPREAAHLDPRQRLILETAWEALEDAGVPPDSLSDSQTGVFMAVLKDDYGTRIFDDYEIVEVYSGTGNANSTVANRLSYFFNLHGPSVAVDTACSGALVSVHLACQSLSTGESTLALAGGVNVILEPGNDVFFSRAGVLSPDGRCKTFDSRANGIVRAEAAGVVVLKPLAQALDDGDRIYAVVRGSAVNQDGRSNGIMAPNGQAQEAVLREAYQRAGIAPGQVQYIEAHGTGTSLGDPIEVQALVNVLSVGRQEGHKCALGSVKTNIGHAEAAAGVVGIIKTLLAFQHRLLPPILHFRDPNPLIPFKELPLFVQQSLGPWPQPSEPLIAGVSGFGFAGTNAHLVLEEAPPSSPDRDRANLAPRACLLPLSARTPEALRALARAYSDFLSSAAQSNLALRDICYTASVRRGHLNYRMAVAGDSREELADHLNALVSNEPAPGLVSAGTSNRQLPLVFVFSGQGSHWLGMGRELMQQELVFETTLQKCDQVFKELAGWSLLEELAADEAQSRLNDTLVAQIAIFSIQVALAALWYSWGLMPSVIVGQSLGEIAAAHVAGALNLEEAARVVYHRARLMKSVEGQGKTAAVGLPLEEAKAALAGFEDRVSVAGSNSPTTSLLSGDPEALEHIANSLTQQGIFCQMLRGVNVAFHSPQMEPLKKELAQALQGIEPRTTHMPLFSTVTATLVDGAQLDAEYWGRNLREPFLFTKAIEQLAQSGYNTFLEISPHPVLGSSILQGLAALKKEGSVIPSLRRGEPERATILASLGALYVQGCLVNWQHLYPEGGQVVSLPTYCWQREHYWHDQLTQRLLGVGARVTAKVRGRHPLLGEHVKASVSPWQHFWEQDLSATTPPYMVDHRVWGTSVLPGAAYLEMALAAAQAALGPGAYRVERISFNQALYLPEDGVTRRIQTVLTPEMPGEASFQVLSSGESANSVNASQEHASGTVRTLQDADAARPNPVALKDIQDRCKECIAGADHYRTMESHGLSYGPAFQAVQQIWRRDGEALSQLQLPATLMPMCEVYQIHPVLLDASFQIVAAASPVSPEGQGGEQVFLPAQVGSLRVYQQPGIQLWCHAVLRPISEAEPDIREADVRLLSEEGQVIAAVEGLRLQRVAIDQGQGGLNRWFYELEWQPMPLSTAAPAQPQRQGNWLIFTAAGEKEPLKALLAERGGNCILVHPDKAYRAVADGSQYWINPESAQDYERLFEAISQAGLAQHLGLLHCWAGATSTIQSPSMETLDMALAFGPGSLLALVQALGKNPSATRSRLWIVTKGAQAVTADEMVSVTQAALWGMGRVVANEQPELRCALIDLSAMGAADDLGALVEELGAEQPENQIALRGSQRYVARLMRHAPAPAATVKQRYGALQDTPFHLEIATPGVLDSFQLRVTHRRKPGPGEVEVEVCAAGLNFKDVMLALGILPAPQGKMVPLGLEGSGRVVAVGEGVEICQVGDQVLVGADHCFSRYVTTSAWLTGPKPASMSFEDAATMLVAFGTSYYAFSRLAHLQPGERVLIHTASGAVGHAAIQLSKVVGAEIFATAGTPEKRAYLQEKLGISHVMDSRSLSFADEILELTDGEGVDVVLNTLSGAGITKSLSVLKPYGRFVELGKRDIVLNSMLRMGLLERNISLFVLDFNQLMRDRPKFIYYMLGEIWPLFLDGRLQPPPAQVFSISQAAEAFQLLAQAKHIGKVVLTLGDLSMQAAPLVTPHVEIRENSTYLITGGLGGLGRTVARWLVDKGARHLALTSRRGRGALSPQEQEMVASLEASGACVLVAAGNVANQAEMEHILDEIAATMPPLGGVIHAAGVLNDSIMLQMSHDQLTQVMDPKVKGAWNLHTLTQDMPLDFFVLFSSIASLIGVPGQSNYAAGNAFMDTLAHYRRACGLPGQSINWGPWAEVGMAARQALGEKHAAGGVHAIAPQQGIQILERLLEENPCQVTVAPFDWQQISHTPLASSPLISDLVKSEVGGTGVESMSKTDFLEKVWGQATPEEQPRLLETHLVELVAHVLHLDRSRLDAHQPLNTLGIDSIMAVELSNKISGSLGVSVSIADLLRGLSIADLVEKLLPELAEDAEVTELLAEAEQLSDQDLEALLSEERVANE